MILSSATKAFPVLYAIIGFGLLIIVHELGHFLFCKAFGISTPTFSIGMGPTIFQKKIGTTNFKLSALPLGGYVEIAGLAEPGQGEQKHSQEEGDGAFKSKPYWQKLFVLAGGVTFNLLFAYLVFIFIFMIGFPKSEIFIQEVEKTCPAATAGILAGDKLIKIGESNIKENPELLKIEREKILSGKYTNVILTVLRNNELKEFKVQFDLSNKEKPKLGVIFNFGFAEEKERFAPLEAIKKGIYTTNQYIYVTVYSLTQMFKNKSLKGAGGPVLIISETVKFAQKGFFYLFMFLAIISISLAIMNLIPLPVLDGGQILFTTIEAIIGKEIPINIKNYISIGSIFLLLLTFLYITYNDILYLIKR
ncbi:TPA: hypothetical protein DEO28_02960 [Candidatus Dependentiae bacterium]|nr:MAG: Site-2 protease [candidate division TM6 bacterium GW2011_GWE2_31_21]KKP53133.1 MAG: Site-2 protease [candidate division TM6 bacterium GW2011_GWF2_33_332]HBS47952.1 hypothetical protein [Candidatus Dependentiae bacterium]HBZ73444.1 hypothetical protein [Candidatus Dependentiae bacterium]